MAHPVPPQIQAAQQQLQQAIASVEKKEVDLAKAPWTELEQAVIKLLGGKFDLARPEHQVVAMGLCGVLADRLITEHGAFWFFDRDAPEGASLGFPTALVMLSPLGATIDALARGNLPQLENTLTEIRRGLAQARFAPTGQAGAVRLNPEDYQRLFDAGFVQFLAVDMAKAKEAWDAAPEKLARDLKDAIGRSTRIPAEARPQLEGQLVGALDRLERGKPLIDQVDRAPRVGELIVHLFGSKEGTGFAPEELWHEIVMPLLFIGAPDKFPPLENEDVESYKQGADILALFVDLVPNQQKQAEDGLLGVFPADQLGLAHDKFRSQGGTRLIKIGKAPVEAALRAFDATKSRASLAQFTQYVEDKAGLKRGAQPSDQLVEAAMQLLTDLRRLVVETPNTELFMRRCTEAEASSETALALVRDALKAPRIILA